VHVLRHIADCRAKIKAVDFGGGNSILCYELAQRGHIVLVLDIDHDVCRVVRHNAKVLGLESRLSAVKYDGHSSWPVLDLSLDAVFSISVFEAMSAYSRSRFFVECFRSLRRDGELLCTCDYGSDARFVANAPSSREDLLADVVAPSGLQLVEDLPEAPVFDDELPPPVGVAVPSVDGFEQVLARYTFAAVRLRKVDGIQPDPLRTRPSIVTESRAVTGVFEAALSWSQHVGALQSVEALAVALEIWGPDEVTAVHYAISATDYRRTKGSYGEARFVIAGTSGGLLALFGCPDSLWPLYYRGEIEPRGDVACLMRLLDRFPAVIRRSSELDGNRSSTCWETTIE
jgi:SAM-dependent methyltransferase